jgi:acyl-CoA synthetase (AMP-forming)/AMP-acid ligase II
LINIFDTSGAPINASEHKNALLQYSSGTTGLKKGVLLSELALVDHVDNCAQALNLRPSDRIASWLPLYHDMGLIAGFVIPWLKGIPIVSMSPFDWLVRPDVFLKTITETRSTLMWQPNFAFSYLARTFRSKDLSKFDLSAMRMIINCAEPVTAAAQSLFLETFGACGVSAQQMATSYALAEVTFSATYSTSGRPPATASVDPGSLGLGQSVRPGDMMLVSCGKPINGTNIEIVNEVGQVCAPGNVGEIKIKTSSMMRGYLGINPKETFDANGALLTGDVGFLQAGELYVLGRKDDTLIVRGQNVYPQAVEELVSQVPGVVPGRCVAFGSRMQAQDSEDLIILAESRDPDLDKRSEIANKIISIISKRFDLTAREIRIVDHMSLKKSTSGKIARKANKDVFEQSLDISVRNPALHSTGVFATALRAFINAEFAKGRKINDQTVLISSGMVDSLGLVTLMLFAEEHSNKIAPSPLIVGFDKYDSIERILRLFDGLSDTQAAIPVARPTPIWKLKLDLYKNSDRDFDFVLFSSSTLINIPTRYLKTIGMKSFNFGVHSGKFIYFYAILRFIEDNGQSMPRKIVLGVDSNKILFTQLSPTFIHKNPDFDTFLAEIDLPVSNYAVSDNNLSAKKDGIFARRLFALQQAEGAIIRNIYQLLENGDQCFVDPDYVPMKTISDVTFQSDITKMKISLPREGDFVPRSSGRAIQGVAEIARRNKIHVDIVLPPLHPVCLNEMFEEPRYNRSLELTLGLIEFAKFDDVSVHDFRDIRTFGGIEDDFDDALHLGLVNAGKLLKKLFPDLPDTSGA